MTDTWSLDEKRDWLARLCGWEYDEEFTGWFTGEFVSEIFSADHPMTNSDLLSAGCDPLMRAKGYGWDVGPGSYSPYLAFASEVGRTCIHEADTLNAALVEMFFDALHTEEKVETVKKAKISCPSCGCSSEVVDGLGGGLDNDVRCLACGHMWTEATGE